MCSKLQRIGIAHTNLSRVSLETAGGAGEENVTENWIKGMDGLAYNRFKKKSISPRYRRP